MATPRVTYQADYWVGNDFVDVREARHDLFSTLGNLHEGAGLGVGWVLLADTIGGR